MGDSKEQTVVLVKRILYDVGEICSTLSTPEGRKAVRQLFVYIGVSEVMGFGSDDKQNNSWKPSKGR